MKIKLFEVSVLQVIIRFYIMMAIVLIGGFMGNLAIMSIGMLVFVTAVLAIKFEFGSAGTKETVGKTTATNLSRLPEAA